ncbi:MAG: hypothetical protein HY901_27855 [Deltaproteobacteria bacterium]|nr:hypothetical protein [Deltaproteobacteria bacterium]
MTLIREPELASAETIKRHSAYQALQPIRRPTFWGVDLDPSVRPGVPMMSPDPKPWPHTNYPPERQAGRPSSPKHARPNMPMPPVFGTAVPLRGLSGVVRLLAYRYPDHSVRHWGLLLVGDRVDSWSQRVRRYWPLALPLAAVLLSRRHARE